MGKYTQTVFQLKIFTSSEGGTVLKDVSHLLTKKDDIRTCLFPRYVKLRDVGNIFSRMMGHNGTLDGIVDMDRYGGTTIKVTTQALRDRWGKLKQLLEYELKTM